MNEFENYKSGYAALIGKPNAGKSTLLNQLLKFKISIVTRKPQTTRKNILGILTGNDYQIVFIDTPGLLNPRYGLQEFMLRYIRSALQDSDVLIYLVDVAEKKQHFENIHNQLQDTGKPVILALNKIDLVDKASLLPLIERFRKSFNFRAIIPISALKSDGITNLIEEILEMLPYNPPYFPPDYATDQQERFFVSEIIREKIFQYFGEEIPYSTHVQIEDFKERKPAKDYIRAVIFVEKHSQKGIIIGKGGQALKRVGETARTEIEQFLGRPVYLELYVKLLEDWRRREGKLKNLGY
jgi:GTP-binding protein Era